jgi:membrane protein DedA with SNARE-associated domain
MDTLATPLAIDLVEELVGSGGGSAYALLVLAWVAGACGVPVPEEAVFAVGGALAARGQVLAAAVYALGWTVVLLLDGVLFTLGARCGPALETSRWGRKMGPARWEGMRRLVLRRGVWAVAGARFVMGTRIPVFLLAGALGMPARRFLPVVALAGLLSAALPLALGYVFAAHLPELLAALGTARWALLALVAVGLAAWIVMRRARRGR